MLNMSVTWFQIITCLYQHIMTSYNPKNSVFFFLSLTFPFPWNRELFFSFPFWLHSFLLIQIWTLRYFSFMFSTLWPFYFMFPLPRKREHFFLYYFYFVFNIDCELVFFSHCNVFYFLICVEYMCVGYVWGMCWIWVCVCLCSFHIAMFFSW